MSKSEPVSTVRWEEPPPQTSRRYDWSTIAEQLRSMPGEWAVVFDEDKASIVTALRAGAITVMRPSRGFEFTTANNARERPRTCTLYARYVPEKDREN